MDSAAPGGALRDSQATRAPQEQVLNASEARRPVMAAC